MVKWNNFQSGSEFAKFSSQRMQIKIAILGVIKINAKKSSTYKYKSEYFLGNMLLFIVRICYEFCLINFKVKQ